MAEDVVCAVTELMPCICHTTDANQLHVLAVIGIGRFGGINKGIWHGSVVDSKETPTVENQKSLQNEVKVYRYNIIWPQLFSFAFMVVNFIHRTSNNPNTLSLLGIMMRKESVILITNYVRGNNLHMIFDKIKTIL